MRIKYRARTFEWTKANIGKDVEMQPPHRNHQIDGREHRHMVALGCLFGLTEAQLCKWPGAVAYCRYLEKCFQPLLANEYASVWTTVGSRKPQTTVECWPWFNAVASTMQKLKDDQSSIEEVWKRLTPVESGSNTTTSVAQDPTPCFVALFSVLCWGTMTLQPRLSWTDFKDCPSLMVHQQQPDQPGLKMDFVRRPIPAIFRHFQRTMLTTRWRHPISESKTEVSTVLHVASLNYAALNTIGKIHLVWVDNLTSHLEFDAANRRLSIFKFPSFCALSTLADAKIPPVFVG